MPRKRFLNSGQMMRSVGALSLFFSVSATASFAQGRDAASLNTYGLPGLVDMPSAETLPDATLATSIARFGNTTRTTLTFQLTPKISGSFRYTSLRDFQPPGYRFDDYFDRSFDLRYQIVEETNALPGVAVGLQDFIGTGLYGGEYLVATKTLAPGLKATAGLGWGRLGSFGSFASTGSRPSELLGEGGIPTYDRWFRGDVAGFAGVSYAPNDRWNLKLEYSSDNYNDETALAGFQKKSPWNYGFDYRFKNGGQLSLYHLYGSEIGAQLSFYLNPKTTGVPGGLDAAPLPVSTRAAQSVNDLGWTADNTRIANARASLGRLAETEGLEVEALKLEPRRATVRLLNPTYGSPAQAIGRISRAMTRSLPASIEEFVIVPVVRGMPTSAVILKRSDVERHEHDAASVMLDKAQIVEGYGLAPRPDKGIYPQFTWGISPYLNFSVFDPDNPARADLGVRASAKLEFSPNIVLSGSLTKKVGGNLDRITRQERSNLPRVRTDRAEYSRQGDPAIEHLQLALYGRPGKNLYSRLTVGYLETMYAGASAEVLWKPVNSRLAFGAELNYVLRRDFDQLFGTQSMTTIDPVSGAARTIPNLNGHVSAYYDFGNGFHGQVDVGRYLAGDYGATVALDREFANGWRVGAYATFTNASFEDFGEGSFDKGIRVVVPISSFTGKPSRNEGDITIQSLTRDGGARLDVRGRLYEDIRDYHEPDIAKSWGRFWR